MLFTFDAYSENLPSLQPSSARKFGLFSSTKFFIISNFGVWVGSSFYEQNLQGLINCYIMAIPFFTNTLISTALFASLFEILLKYRIFFTSSQFRKVN